MSSLVFLTCVLRFQGTRGKQTNYLMMRLYNGRVQLVLKTRKRVEISTQAVFNDGIWHKVRVISTVVRLDVAL